MAYADFKDLLFGAMGDVRGWSPRALAETLSVESWVGPNSSALNAFRKLRQDARIRACRRAIKERGLELLSKVGSDFIRDQLSAPSSVDVIRGLVADPGTIALCIETVEARIRTAKACSYSEPYIAGMEDILVFHRASLERVLRGDHFHPTSELTGTKQ